MSILHNASRVAISGGTLTINQGNQAGAGSALKDLSAAAAHTAMHNSLARFDAPRCHRNTRAKYRGSLERWTLGENPDLEGKRLIWLHGGAGAGKSAIMQSVVEQCAQHGSILGSFFFSRADSSRNCVDALVPTLAYQVAQAFPEAMTILEPVVMLNPLIFKSSLHIQAVELLIRPLLYLFENGIVNNTRVPRRVFVIDGLDECADPDKQAVIIRVITSIICDHHLPICFMIASRPEIAICSAFECEKQLHATISTINLDNDDDAESDICQFIEDSFLDILDSHPLRRHIKSPWPHPDSVDRLVWKSSSHFMYAATVMKFIASPDEHPGRALKVVEGLAPSRTESPFAELDALYTHILTSARYSKQVLKILGHCYLSGFPRSVTAICHIHDISLDDVLLFLSAVQSIVSLVPDNVGELSVYPKHASLGEFLTDEARSQELYIAKGSYHASLLARYFQLLDDGICIISPSFWSSPTRDVEMLISSLANGLRYSQDTDLLQSVVAHHSPYDVWNFCMKSVASQKALPSFGIRGLGTASIAFYIAALRESVALCNDALYSHQVQMYMQLALDVINDLVQKEPQFCIISALIFSSGHSGLYLACDMLDFCNISVPIGKSGLNKVLNPLIIGTFHEKIDPRAFRAIRQMPQSQTSWSSELAVAMELVLRQLIHLPGSAPSILRTNPHRQWLLKQKSLSRISFGSLKLSSTLFHWLIHQYGSDGPDKFYTRKSRHAFLLSRWQAAAVIGYSSNKERQCRILLQAVAYYLPKSNCTNEVVMLARRSLPRVAQWYPKLMKKARLEMDAYVCRWEDSPEGLLQRAKLLRLNDVD